MRTISKSEAEKRNTRKAKPKEKPAPSPAAPAPVVDMSVIAKSIADANNENAKMIESAVKSLHESVKASSKKEPVRLKIRRYDNDPEKGIDYVDVVPLKRK